MTTIPTRLARATVSSVNLVQARARAKSLYRDWYRAVSPDVLAQEAGKHELLELTTSTFSCYAFLLMLVRAHMKCVMHRHPKL